ncbi:Succinylornithine transaminase/acetylornithine aminotransferase [compost metagenome]
MKEVRGKGLLIGIECTGPVGDIILAGQKEGLLFVQAGPNVIRLLPNLYVTIDEIHQAVDILVQLIHTYVNKGNGEAHS